MLIVFACLPQGDCDTALEHVENCPIAMFQVNPCDANCDPNILYWLVHILMSVMGWERSGTGDCSIKKEQIGSV